MPPRPRATGRGDRPFGRAPDRRGGGARAAAVRASDGRVVAVEGLPRGASLELEAGELPKYWPEAQVVETTAPGAMLIVWTSPYAPFFGADERNLLQNLASLTGIALDRVRLFEQEHRARIALEYGEPTDLDRVLHELRG